MFIEVSFLIQHKNVKNYMKDNGLDSDNYK